MNRELLETWSQWLESGTALRPEREAALLELLRKNERIREQLLDDFELDGALRETNGSSEQAATFIGEVRAWTRHEGDRETFTADTKRRIDRERRLGSSVQWSWMRRWPLAAALAVLVAIGFGTAVVVRGSPGEIRSFTLLDADTEMPIPGFDPIPDGAVLVQTRLPKRLSIRANVHPKNVPSVRFSIQSGPLTGDVVENWAPYLFPGGPAHGEIVPWVPMQGPVIVRATPCRRRGGEDCTGTTHVIHLNVVATAGDNP